ncbi:DNA-binding response regulator [Denitratisoma sp. DHT3]|uniref:response regulator transcription factor n=1 Tax=Denitratisoma sp. DHT3 TaxID=1981880 RepID=UPI001198B431|nr:response regulator transcription factor [Denitratisoma sp. DHT3]QDX82557.1 DNA-binding response regulator [Denitratisoma sp. DHT3]
MLKLLVVEDHALVREGLLQTLRDIEPNTVAIGAADADEALQVLEATSNLDMVLLDLMLPGLNGMAFLAVLRKRFPALPVVILSALDDAETVKRAIEHGASGFVPKASTSESMLDALRQVLAGGVYLPPRYRDGGEQPRRRSVAERYGLTASQSRVLELLTQGKTNRQIGELLGLTEGTVKIHMSAIFKALNVNNRSQALLAVSKPRRRI